MARSAWRLSGYTVEALLGRGSSGEVWRARVDATGVAVAVKRIPLGGGAWRRAALGEAAVLSALDHPHLMGLHDVRQVDDALVLVLDLCEGGSLADLLHARGRLTPGEVITALAPIGAALDYAHGHGVVHGDVSAANVLFTRIGLPLLGDLGVARLLGDVAPVRTTPAYADPAVAAGGLPGPASDVFMLAAVAFHALTGAPPWPGERASAVLGLAAGNSGAASVWDRAEHFAARLAGAGTPDPVAEVVLRGLAVDPRARGTAAGFALELRAAGRPVAVELAAGPPRPALGPDGPGDGESDGDDGPAADYGARTPLTDGVRAPAPFVGGRHHAQGSSRGARLRRAVVVVGVAACAVALASAWSAGRPAPASAPARAPAPASARAQAPARASATASAPASAPASAAAQAPAAAPGVSAAAAAAAPIGPEPGPGPSRAQSSAPPSVSAPARESADTATGPAVAGGPARTAALARRLLALLDARRAAAWAARSPGLLRRVYADRALRQQDAARLRATLGPGCRLIGLHTGFEGLDVITATANRLRLQVTARVGASRLRCPARPPRTLGAAAPQRLAVTLSRSGDGWLIADEHRAEAPG